MSKAAAILDSIRNAPSWKRLELLEEIEQEYGRGFAKAIRDACESEDLLRGNEAAARRERR